MTDERRNKLEDVAKDAGIKQEYSEITMVGNEYLCCCLSADTIVAIIEASNFVELPVSYFDEMPVSELTFVLTYVNVRNILTIKTCE